MKAFVSNNHRYASTADPGYNENKKWVSNITIWGKLTPELVFEPNLRFMLLKAEEKKKYIFPECWDISAAFRKPETEDEGGDVYDGEEDQYRIYGNSLLLEKAAESCGLREDLTTVFDTNITDRLLSVSYFLILSEKNLNRMESEAKVQWFPTQKGLSPDAITRLSQAITREQINSFMALRKKRNTSERGWFGIDSTSVSSYSRFLSDAHWGKNKEHDNLKQLNLMVMYDMASELPVHYRNLPGNIPDSRTLRLLIEELKAEDFNDFGLILDRAYLTKENLTLFVGNGYKGIFMAKTSDAAIKREIEKAETKEGSLQRTGIFLPDFDCYAKECIYPFSYKKEGEKGRGEEANQRLCLFYDPEMRGVEEKEIAKAKLEGEESIKAYIQSGIPVDNAIMTKLKKYFDLTVTDKSVITSYVLNQDKVDEALSLSGYFAIVCVNMGKDEYPLSWVLSSYRRRDLQEKAFTYLKSWQNGRRLRTSTELSTEGRKFFQFVSLIVNCQLHHLYFNASEELRKKFSSVWEMLDEMRSVRYIQLKGRREKVSEFVGAQVEIFDEFGFDIPKGSRPATKKPPKKIISE
jgi:transposase